MNQPNAARQPLFRPGGDLYAALPIDLFYGLDADLKASALEVMGVLVDKHRAGDLDETLTDKDIAELIHRSVSFVQKGLHTLHNGVADVLDIVITRTRARGRRTIAFVRGLRGSQPQKAPPPPAPPLPLSEEEQKDKTTTAGSSSSLINPPEPTDGAGPDPAVVRALFDRARQLVRRRQPRCRRRRHGGVHRRFDPPGAGLDGEAEPQAGHRPQGLGLRVGDPPQQAADRLARGPAGRDAPGDPAQGPEH